MHEDIVLTPMMKQFLDLKAKHPDAVMLFRCGDFYETYSTDAVVASEILGITLTKRANGKGKTIEMAGFPHHALDTYLPKLIRAGKRVAICDQLEDPKLTKKLVKRGITELVTPGVSINDNVLNYRENNFLAAVHFGKGACGVAFLDISTGEFLTAEGPFDYVDKLLNNFAPKEVLFERGKRLMFEGNFGSKFFTFELDDWVFTETSAREKLLKQPEKKAREVALALELFTTGSLDIFGHESTVDMDKRVVAFDIHSLGEQLKPIGHLVITDTMLNRVTLNWQRGKRTHIFIDEFHVMFENEFSAAFFTSAWRQFRKRNAYPTAITQNVEYLLDSVRASTMLSNSESIVMLNQAASDREKLAKLLNISAEQMSYVTNAGAGCGLIKYGSALVPFVNHFPGSTKLYQLMTTRPGEGSFSRGQA